MRRECSAAGTFFVVRSPHVERILLRRRAAGKTAAYQNRCASCHGSAMTGASGPAILTYIRYHTDVEVAAAIRERHANMPAMSLQEAELRQILTGVRVLAGTNPAMATGGFTGRRGGGGGGAAAGAADVVAGVGRGRCACSGRPTGARNSSACFYITGRRRSAAGHDHDGRRPYTNGLLAQSLPSHKRRCTPTGCCETGQIHAALERRQRRIAKKRSRRKPTGRTTTAASPAIATVRSS